MGFKLGPANERSKVKRRNTRAFHTLRELRGSNKRGEAYGMHAYSAAFAPDWRSLVVL